MGMNIQKSAGVKADTFILKRNNMDRWIRMDVAMLINWQFVPVLSQE